MTHRSETQKPLTWTVHHNGPGTIRYYCANDEPTGTRFVAHQLGKSKWVLTATRGDEYVLDATDRTLKAVKALAESHLAGLDTQVAPDASEAVSEAPSASEGFDWANEKKRGSYGRTHSATATVDGVRYSAVVDSPQPGTWIFRGWIDGVFRAHENVRTACAGRDAAEAWLRAETSPQPEASPGTVTAVDEGATIVRQSPTDVTVKLTQMIERMKPVVAAAVHAATESLTAFRKANARYGCGCSSPVHRMSCGVGARPVVVRRPRPCMDCGGEGGGGSMDPDAWFTCIACEGLGTAPAGKDA